MSVIINKWNDGSGDSINIESPSFQGNQTIKISSLVQKGTSKRSMRFIGKCKKDSSKQVILTVEQEASIYTYLQGAEDHAVNFAQLTQRAGNFLVSRTPIEHFDWSMIKGTYVLGGRKGGMPEMVFEYILKKNQY